ncbi:BON domain-containing protein [Streptomyces sp. SAS_272]|uniref:BON domain-containing protein n=1 Tax=Streptomyces sp. SAS_272 TaxID=3412747 RepID=UPI00403CACF9
MRREVVSYLFPQPGSQVRVEVRDGAVKLVGQIRDMSLVPVAARLVRAVEGVVDVDFDVSHRGEAAHAEEDPADGTRSGRA